MACTTRRRRPSVCPYTPQPTDTDEQLAQRAFAAGRDLRPADTRASWIDSHPLAQDGLIASYHAGQAEQYECEDW